MALALTIDRKIVEVKLINVFFTIVASGNYAAGGEVPTVAAAGGNPAIAGIKAAIGAKAAPLYVVIQGKAGFVYVYDYATEKVMVFVNTAGGVNTALGEHTAVAYVAGITGDTIKGYAIFAKA